MQYYGISESRIKRIVRFPKRTEEGIAPDTVAVMQPADTKRYSEIWVMYKLVGENRRAISNFQFPRLRQRFSGQAISKQKEKNQKSNLKINIENFRPSEKKIKIITAWRYPGESPERDPVPQEILGEIRNLL